MRGELAMAEPLPVRVGERVRYPRTDEEHRFRWDRRTELGGDPDREREVRTVDVLEHLDVGGELDQPHDVRMIELR